MRESLSSYLEMIYIGFSRAEGDLRGVFCLFCGFLKFIYFLIEG